MKIILLAAILLSEGIISDAPAASSELQVGSTAPTFKARNLVTGDNLSLAAQRGKLVIVTFWATWCGPCQRELPILEGAQEFLGKDKLVVLAVNFRDSPNAVAQLRKLAKSWQISLLQDDDGRIAASYNIRAIPHLFMINRDGKIVASHTGYGDRSIEELVADINAALREDSPAGAPSTPTQGDPPPSGGD